MKFINILSVFIFIISQNILMASSAYAALSPAVATLTDKTTSCATACGFLAGTPVTGDNLISFAITNMAGASPGASNTKSGINLIGDASPTLPEIKDLCINPCETYRGEVGFNLGELDAVANLSSNTLSKAICNAFRIVTGGAGKTFASFAVIATGIGFFTGKVSWGLMIGVAAGIATMFGASSIVAAISGEKVETQCGLNFKQ